MVKCRTNPLFGHISLADRIYSPVVSEALPSIHSFRQFYECVVWLLQDIYLLYTSEQVQRTACMHATRSPRPAPHDVTYSMTWYSVVQHTIDLLLQWRRYKAHKPLWPLLIFMSKGLPTLLESLNQAKIPKQRASIIPKALILKKQFKSRLIMLSTCKMTTYQANRWTAYNKVKVYYYGVTYHSRTDG